MKKMKCLITVLLLLFLSSPVYADDFQDGLDAYNRKDYMTAFEKLKPLAEQGHAKAQFKLGVFYEIGQGVPQDYKEAVKWYRLAANQGNASAQSNLGVMYDKGQGVTQDYVQAHKWYNIAGANGSELGRKNRDLIEKIMTPKDISEAQKLAREWMEGHQKE